MQIKVNQIKSSENEGEVFLKAFKMGQEAALKVWSE